MKPEEALEIFKDVALLLEDAVIDEVHKREIIGEVVAGQKSIPRKTPARKEPWVWLVPYNAKFFDVEACIAKFGEVFFMQFVNFQTGDTGYLYATAPDSCIRFRFEVTGHDLPYTPVMDREKEFNAYRMDVEAIKKHNRFALLRMTGKTHSSSLRLSNLIDQGLKMAPRGSLKLSNKDYRELQKYIEENF